MSKIRPMLAASFEDQYDLLPELKLLQYPLLGSPKIDGIRFLRPANDGARSRSWKLLPNKRLQELVQNPLFEWLDGEVIVGTDPKAEGLFNRTQSAVMTASDQSQLSIYFFDHWFHKEATFQARSQIARCSVEKLRKEGVHNIFYLNHVLLHNPEEVLAYEQEALEAGYEGIMLRHPLKPYKYGRSTFKEQGLIKVKRFIDEEARIVGFEELQRNQNEAIINHFGLQVRGHSKAGKVAGGTLGKLLLRNEKWGDFACGSGLDDELRARIWANKDDYLQRIVTYKYQPHGAKEKPRTPIFKGFRPEVD